MLKLQKTLFVDFFGWRVDDRVPELVEFLPLFSLGKGWLAVGEYCLVGMPEAEEREEEGKRAVTALIHARQRSFKITDGSDALHCSYNDFSRSRAHM